MTSVKLTDMMSASSGDVIASLGTSVSMGKQTISSDQQSFATVMNGTAQNRKSPDNPDVSRSRNDNGADVKENYRASNRGNAMDRKVTQAAVGDSGKFRKLEENQEEITGEFSQGMKELLTGQLDVSEEELEAAMTALGLSYLDLLNPSNLTLLAARLIGTEDTCTLLMNEDFTQLLQQSDWLVSDLTESTGLSREEILSWQDLQNQWMVTGTEEAQAEPATDHSEGGVPVPAEMMEEVAEPVTEVKISDEAVDTFENGNLHAAGKKNGSEVQQLSEGKETKTGHDEQTDGRMEEAAAVKEKRGETDTEQEQTFSSGQFQGEMFEKDGEKSGVEQLTHTQNTGFENVRAEVAVEMPIQTQTAPSNVDVQELMQQFVEFARLHVTQDTTSIDMQLNPENLGKLYLHVSTGREGNVTAEIAASSQEVKEALETQIAELRITLNQQGVKVDAVEVTVASHEFDQNLEQNAARDQQQGEEREQQSRNGVRSLFRGELDDLTGITSEEELLAARIMKDNGNTMDVTV
ncbi:MAG: flagellar hook-length control protein FliK [Roseburia sp.]